MSKKPELGQMMFGNPTGKYGTEEWQDALIDYLLEEIKRVYWNRNQEELDNFDDCKLKGIKIKSYYWGNDKRIAKKPNLKFIGLEQEIYWYKYPVRGQSCSKKLTTKEWIKWFNQALKIIRDNE